MNLEPGRSYKTRGGWRADVVWIGMLNLGQGMADETAVVVHHLEQSAAFGAILCQHAPQTGQAMVAGDAFGCHVADIDEPWEANITGEAILRQMRGESPPEPGEGEA